MTFKEFILEHASDDTSRLLFAKGRWPEIDMEQAVTAIECRRKIRSKLPRWHSEPDIFYPDRLCAEQCSSEETAGYKARLAAEISGGGRIADLTGGLGVDCSAFAAHFKKVLYNEMDSSRAEAARHNFKVLGLDNIEIETFCASKDETALWARLKEFSPDIIYIDPARRSADGSKVFLIEECSPDVLGLLPQIFSCSKNLMIKLSPMADITMVSGRLEANGADVIEVHCIASSGECKEVLVLAVKSDGCHKEHSTVVYDNGNTMRFNRGNDGNIPDNSPSLMHNIDEAYGMRYLFEPGKALAKSGLFNEICCFGIRKAGIHTHIYFSPEMPSGDIAGFGKTFAIKQILPLSKKTIKSVGAQWPECDVTSRNIPMTSDELRKRTGCRSGGKFHLFGLRMDFAEKQNPGKPRGENYLVVAERL